MALIEQDVELPFTPQNPAVVVLRKGDRVLIAMAEDPSPDDAVEYMRGLSRSFPGVEFALLGNVAGLAILPGDPPKRGAHE